MFDPISDLVSAGERVKLLDAVISTCWSVIPMRKTIPS
jgi:hypothetical protein